MGNGLVMTSQEYLTELERRFDRGDARGAYMLWLGHRDERLDLGLSVEERRRLRGTLHLVLQMAAEFGWDHSATVESTVGQRSV
jgi:hypothetical protein